MALISSQNKGKGGEPDVAEMLDELVLKMDRLKVLYEQYFMGIEKMEPQTARKEVTRKLLEIQQMHIRNTAVRYRFNALNQKFGVYTTYWNRTLRAIENGTYFRQLARVGRQGQDIPDEVLKAMPEKMREKVLKDRAKVAARADKLAGEKTAAEAAKAPPGHVHRVDDDVEFDEAFDGMFAEEAKPSSAPKPTMAAAKPAAPALAPAPPPPAARPPVAKPAAAAAPPPRRSTPLPPGMDEKSTEELYKRFVQAKKLLGENTDNIKLEHIVATISKQAPAIMEQHKAKGVEFSVVIRDDKVILKATPKK